MIGPHRIVRCIAVTTTCIIDHAVMLGPFGFERDVVLKRILPGLDRQDHERAARGLLREAAALARLSHPAIVRLYELVDQAGAPVLVLEHVDGLSLASLLDALDANATPLDDACSLYVGYRIFCALAAAHGASDPASGEPAPIVHGDVSPANVLVPWDGHVKLADFDLGRVPAPGTLGFASPEQAHGSPASCRSDVFSACLVLRELLLRAAFVATTEAPLSLRDARPGLHPSLVDLVERALRLDPGERTVTAAEIAAQLRALVDIESARERLVHHLSAFVRRATPGEGIAVCPPPSHRGERSDLDEGSSSFRPTAVSVIPATLADLRTVKTARRKKQQVLRAFAVLGVASLAVASGVFALRSAGRFIASEPGEPGEPGAPSQAAVPPDPVEAPEPAPAEPASEPEPEATADPTSDADGDAAADAAKKTGRILTDASMTMHRIFVDGRSVGHGGAPIVVRCGRHVVRIGSSGVPRPVDVPCGGEVSVR